MRLVDRLRLRFRSLFRRNRVERELDDELKFHIESLVERLIAQGVPADEARSAALRKFGVVAPLQEECRDHRRTGWIEDFFYDLRYVFRVLAKSPGFAAVALLSLALGIGANSAIFSLFETIVLRELPVQRPGELVQIAAGDGRNTRTQFSYPIYERLRANSSMFADLFAWHLVNVWAGEGESMEWISVAQVTDRYFAGLGASARLGRVLGEEKAQPAVAVLSHDWWTARFHQDPGVIGQELRLGGLRFTIVGVMPQQFFGVEVGKSADVYMPLEAHRLLAPYSDFLTTPDVSWLPMMGRLHSQDRLQQAMAGFPAVWRSAVEASGARTGGPNPIRNFKGELRPAAHGISRLRFQFSRPLNILFWVAGLVLLIACVNLANLLLARAFTRQREIALRTAIGASSGRLFRQLLTESLVLAAGGAALGLLFAQWSTAILISLLSSRSNPVSLAVSINPRVLLFTAGLGIFTTLIFGLAPVMRSLRQTLQPALKESSHQVSGRQAWSRSLLVAQVALSLLLSVGAALFLRTFENLISVDPGFDAERVLVAEVQPIRVGITDAAGEAFYRDLTARLAALPGVIAASSSDGLPIEGCCWLEPITVEGYTPAPGENTRTFLDDVAPDFFKAMGIRLVRGREFTAGDTVSSTPVTVVSESFARRYFPGQDPLGRYISLPPGPRYSFPRKQIIGVVADTFRRNLRAASFEAAYFPMAQDPGNRGALQMLVRTSGPALAMAGPVQQTIHGFHPGIPVTMHTLAQDLEGTLIYERLLALLGGFFGAVALGLAAIGLYGVLSYSVARRTSEIGVRMALGASRPSVLWLVMKQSVILVAIGMLIGGGAALALARYVESMLYGMKPADPLALAIGVAGLVLVTALAAWLPARRATSVDPVRALHYE